MNKELPHDYESERGILGSILLDPNSFTKNRLKPDDFHIMKHRVLFKELQDMYINDKTMDAITIRNKLNDNNLLRQVGGDEYLLDLMDSTIVASHYFAYQDIVLEKSKLRKEIVIFNEGLSKAFNQESGSDSVMSNLISLNVNEVVDKPLHEHAKDFIDACAKGESGNVNWWSNDWTNHLGRLKNELIIVHAPRSTGKTALILQWILHLHTNGFVAPLASLEMLRSELVPRFISQYQVDTWFMRTRGFITDNEKTNSEKAMRHIKKMKYKIVDGGMDIEELRAWGIAQKKAGADILFIDNLLCINPDKRYDSRTSMYDHIIHQLKSLRDDIKIPVVVLSHPNSDGGIAYSKNVENIADVIIYLMNVPYEGVKVDGNHIARNLDYKGEHVICKFQKNRQGISPVSSLEFKQSYQTFIHKEWH